jgi:hypothetical protein
MCWWIARRVVWDSVAAELSCRACVVSICQDGISRGRDANYGREEAANLRVAGLRKIALVASLQSHCFE